MHGDAPFVVVVGDEDGVRIGGYEGASLVVGVTVVIVRGWEELGFGSPAVMRGAHFPLLVKDGDLLSSGGGDASRRVVARSVAEAFGFVEDRFGAGLGGGGLIVGRLAPDLDRRGGDMI